MGRTNLKLKILIILAVTLAGTAPHVCSGRDEPAAQNGEKLEKGAAKTTITADQQELDFKTGTAILTGDVKVVSGNMILTARKMTTHFDDDFNPVRIDAEEDVVIIQPEAERKATAGRAVYDVAEGVITLSDNPRLEMEGHILQDAKKVTYYRDSERVTSEGGQWTFATDGEDEPLNILNRGQTDDAE